jgi:phosphate transport system permease protein
VAASPRWGEKAIYVALVACAVVSVATTTAIIFALLSPTVGFFGEVSFGDFFSTDDWAPLTADPAFGVLRPVVAPSRWLSGRCCSPCPSACSRRST